MSFNRLNNDKKEYADTYKQSVGPGKYHMFKSPILETDFYSVSPNIIAQKSGVSTDANSQIDAHSELLNLNLARTKDAQHKHLESCGNSCNKGYPCGQGVINKCTNSECGNMKNSNLTDAKDIFIPVESTRLSNPPCTLRGQETFRIDHLYLDPQKNLEMPFANNISVRLYEKDNHVPCNNAV